MVYEGECRENEYRSRKELKNKVHAKDEKVIRPTQSADFAN